MNKVDVFIISIPEFDSPIIRDFIHRYHTYFNKIYYVFNYVNDQKLTNEQKGYIDFIENDLKNKCEFIYQTHENFYKFDWRGLSVNNVLSKSTGDFIFSIEPDFICDWDKIIDIMINKSYDIFSNYTGSPHNLENPDIRLWPSFWGCYKKHLDLIEKNFSAMPDPRVKSLYNVTYNKSLRFEGDRLMSKNVDKFVSYDHFDYVSAQLVDIINDNGNNIILLNNIKDIWYEHASGITQDFSTIKYENKLYRSNNCYKLFYEWCKKCNVNFYKDWEERSEQIINYKFV